MKKVILLLLSTIVLFGISGPVESSITRSTFTASADFTGVSAITFLSVQLRERGTEIAKTSFTFNTSPAALGIGTTWYTANEYAIIFTTWTSGSNGRLLVYTDNRAADANPRFVGPTAVNPAGLLVSTGTTTAAEPLQLCWRVTDISTTTVQILWKIVGGAMKLYCGPNMPDTYYTFLWMNDRSQGTWNEAYRTIKRFDLGGNWIQHAEGEFATAPSPDYFYLGCNYERAKAGWPYRTTTLRFDLAFD